MAKRWVVKAIGPGNLLQKIYESNSNTKSRHKISLFEPDYEACTKWLDLQQACSVVYVSFGSLLGLKNEQMEELAHALIMSKCNFLWVVRASEEHKLPPDFKSLTSERGLVVNWCSQTEVLAHRALACYVTHCGWNSTVEALSSGVPVVAMPHWYDQTTNSKFVEDVWRVGVRVRVGENGVFLREEIARCVQEVTAGRKGKELKRNAIKWKQLAEEAVGNGGTTTNNIQDFVSALLNI